MKNVIITGSNGMIGKLILEKCLKNAGVSKVTAILRKPSGIRHPKLVEILHDNFLDYNAIKEHLEDQQVCFYCIGVYTGAVSAEEFGKITIDFTRAFAKTLREASPKVIFNFLSGQGADLSEKSLILFARDKGKAENILLNLKFDALYIFRPGYIYPVQKRKEPNLLYRIMRVLYKLGLRKIYPDAGVTSEELSDVMVLTGLSGGAKVIYENRDIRQLAKKVNKAGTDSDRR